MNFPLNRIAEPRTVRLVASARHRPPVLKKLSEDEAVLADLAEIEGATSGRLNVQSTGGDNITPNEMVAGVPHAYFINAAFSYWLPKALNRFNGPGRGAWYAALTTETCIAEVSFHMTRELTYVNDFNAVVEYAELFASFAGEFVDLRGVRPIPPCLDPNPAIAYPEGNQLAEVVRTRGNNGIVYPSIRHATGTCLVALRPQAVQSVAQGKVIKLTWAGNRTPTQEIPAAS